MRTPQQPGQDSPVDRTSSGEAAPWKSDIGGNGVLLEQMASASSTLNLGVQPLQFCSGVIDCELPVDAALLGVGLVGPDPDFGLEQGQFAEAAVAQTLTGQTT